MRLSFTIPGEPKAKQRPRVTHNGIAYTPKETVSYENLVRVIYLENCAQQEMFSGEVKATIEAYYSIPKSASKKSRVLMLEGKMNPVKKPDCDNVAKIILDSLNKLAYNDDSAVTQLTVVKRYSESPKVIVTLEDVTYTAATLSV